MPQTLPKGVLTARFSCAVNVTTRRFPQAGAHTTSQVLRKLSLFKQKKGRRNGCASSNSSFRSHGESQIYFFSSILGILFPGAVTGDGDYGEAVGRVIWEKGGGGRRYRAAQSEVPVESVDRTPGTSTTEAAVPYFLKGGPL